MLFYVEPRPCANGARFLEFPFFLVGPCDQSYSFCQYTQGCIDKIYIKNVRVTVGHDVFIPDSGKSFQCQNHLYDFHTKYENHTYYTGKFCKARRYPYKYPFSDLTDFGHQTWVWSSYSQILPGFFASYEKLAITNRQTNTFAIKRGKDC